MFLLPVITTSQRYPSTPLSGFLIIGGIKRKLRHNMPITTNKGSKDSKLLIIPIIKARARIPHKNLKKPSHEGLGPDGSDRLPLPHFLHRNAS